MIIIKKYSSPDNRIENDCLFLHICRHFHKDLDYNEKIRRKNLHPNDRRTDIRNCCHQLENILRNNHRGSSTARRKDFSQAGRLHTPIRFLLIIQKINSHGFEP